MKKPVCPLCEEEMVMIMNDASQNTEPQIFALNELVRKPDGTYGINQERGLPVVVSLCNACGYLMQFSAHKFNRGQKKGCTE